MAPWLQGQAGPCRTHVNALVDYLIKSCPCVINDNFWRVSSLLLTTSAIAVTLEDVYYGETSIRLKITLYKYDANLWSYLHNPNTEINVNRAPIEYIMEV